MPAMFRSIILLLGIVGAGSASVGGLIPPGLGGLVIHCRPVGDVHVHEPSASSLSFQLPKVFSLWWKTHKQARLCALVAPSGQGMTWSISQLVALR
jgi:hypothetical protein